MGAIKKPRARLCTCGAPAFVLVHNTFFCVACWAKERPNSILKTFEVVTLPKKRAKRITRHAVLDLLSVAVNIGQNLEDASNKTGDARRALIESAYDWAKALLREIEGIDIS